MKSGLFLVCRMIVAVLVGFGFMGEVGAAILYDGSDTSGVTTNDIFVIDFDESSASNIDLHFGNSTRFLRWDGMGCSFSFLRI